MAAKPATVATGKPEVAAKPVAAATAPKGQPTENLTRRVNNVIAARQRRFKAASAAIDAHRSRVASLTDEVAKSGADVSKVRAYLDESAAALASAQELEAAVEADLLKVPGSANPKAGLAEARAAGKKAVAQLKVARSKIIDAVHELQSVVKSTQMPDEASESS